MARFSDDLLFEDPVPTVAVYEGVLSANLHVRILCYGYFTFARYAKANSIISGTGLTTPTFRVLSRGPFQPCRRSVSATHSFMPDGGRAGDPRFPPRPTGCWTRKVQPLWLTSPWRCQCRRRRLPPRTV